MVALLAATAEPRQDALADHLSQAADTLHAALMRAIARRADDGEAAISQSQAQAVFALEVALRQQANVLYAELAGDSVAALGSELPHIAALIQTVRRSMDRHDSARHWISLATSLLNLGSAVLARSPERILSSLARVRERLDEAG